MEKTEVFLIRHGKTKENENRCYCGRGTDSELSPEGLKDLQQKAASGLYDSLIKNEKDMMIVTSGMRRTEQTLECILGHSAEHRICPGLCEIDFGEFEGKTYNLLKDSPSYQKWLHGDNESNRCPGGESGIQMAERVLKAYREILRHSELSTGDKKRILIVTHGGPIAAIMSADFPQEGKNRYEWQPPCGCGYRILYADGIPVAYEKIENV